MKGEELVLVVLFWLCAHLRLASRPANSCWYKREREKDFVIKLIFLFGTLYCIAELIQWHHRPS